MKTLRLLLVVILGVLVTIWTSGISSAAQGGGRSGGYSGGSQGGRSGGYSGGQQGGRSGGYSGGQQGGRSGSYQGGRSGSSYRGGSRDGGRSGSYYRGGGRHYDGHHGHDDDWDFGLVVGWPYWGSSWYYPYYYPYYYPNYYPYYYPYSYPYSSEVTLPSEPQEYIERPRQERPSAPSGLWYYCPDSKAYYPYVRECPKGWQTVPAQPPSGIER